MEGTNDILPKIRALNKGLLHEIRKVVIGQDMVAQLCIVALLSRGHILLEGVPGTAKTLLMRTLAHCLGLDFKRVQFTPDLMPIDILGTNIYNMHKSEFVLRQGPIFTQFLLGDEINRTPPKTQSALLQAMQEFEVTIDGVNYPLSQIFIVAATQNPIEQEGTYPLPEAQLDRFLFKLIVDFPNENAEIEMVKRHQHGSVAVRPADLGVKQVTNLQQLTAVQNYIQNIVVSDSLIEYIVTLVRATRESPFILCGASPRSTLMLTNSSRTLAVLKGRDYVIPDDVKLLFQPTIGHRVVLTPSAQIEGVTGAKVLQDIIEATPIPR